MLTCQRRRPCPSPQITAPSEFQGNIIGDVNRRKGIIMGSEQEGDDVIINVSAFWGKSGHQRWANAGEGAVAGVHEPRARGPVASSTGWARTPQPHPKLPPSSSSHPPPPSLLPIAPTPAPNDAGPGAAE